jgi:predicted nucleotidyltransferase component of viral defense system
MITKDELVKIKEMRKINLYYEEKEYLQFIFLNAIAKFPEEFIFKGGTCLRICYGFERASEDLDFSTSLKIKEIKERIRICLKDFSLLGIEHEINTIKEYQGNIRFEILFKGPLYSGIPQSVNTLKIDFNKNKIKYKIAKVIPKVFSDVPLFIISIVEQKEILIEKLRALINRKQARDIYDVWMLLQNNLPIDKNLLKEKFKEEKLFPSQIKEIKFISKEAYETELKHLLHYLPPYEQVKEEIMKNLDLE